MTADQRAGTVKVEVGIRSFGSFGFDLKHLAALGKLVLDYIGVTPEPGIEYDLEVRVGRGG